MIKKPLIDIDGTLTEIDGYDLPNQEDINDTRDLVARLVFNLVIIGIPITDEKLLKLINNHKS